MKQILLICGSMRNGNCKTILEDIQQKFWLNYSTELLYLRDYDITNCHGCMQCRNTDKNECTKGDKVHLVIDKIMDSELVVLATPNYFYNVSGITKDFIDKTVPYYEKGTLKGKKFLFVYTGESTPDVTKSQLDQAIYGFVDCHNLENLGSFAYQTNSINEFANDSIREETTNNICDIIRQQLKNLQS